MISSHDQECLGGNVRFEGFQNAANAFRNIVQPPQGTKGNCKMCRVLTGSLHAFVPDRLDLFDDFPEIHRSSSFLTISCILLSETLRLSSEKTSREIHPSYPSRLLQMTSHSEGSIRSRPVWS